jgi:hypothetical protein
MVLASRQAFGSLLTLVVFCASAYSILSSGCRNLQPNLASHTLLVGFLLGFFSALCYFEDDVEPLDGWSRRHATTTIVFAI